MRESIARAQALAIEFYRAQLHAPGGDRARTWLRQRGVDEWMADGLELGWAPEAWDALTAALSPADRVAAEKASLILRRRSLAGYVDRFRARVVYPIRRDGQVVGFVGQLLDGQAGEVEYLLTPGLPRNEIEHLRQRIGDLRQGR